MGAAPVVAVVALIFGIFASLSAWHLAALVQRLMRRVSDIENEARAAAELRWRQKSELEDLAAAAGFKRASKVVQPTWERKL